MVGEPPEALRPGRSLALAAAEYIWAYDVDHGLTTKEIAAREGLSVGHVRRGVNRARRHDRGVPQVNTIRPSSDGPKLVPLFPLGPLTPTSTCPHTGVRPPRPFVCMVCHASYADDHFARLLADPPPAAEHCRP
jgi:hypothetical protein